MVVCLTSVNSDSAAMADLSLGCMHMLNAEGHHLSDGCNGRHMHAQQVIHVVLFPLWQHLAVFILLMWAVQQVW